MCCWCESLGFGVCACAVLKLMTGPLCDGASAWMMHVLASGSVAVDYPVLTSHFSPHCSRHIQTSCIVLCEKAKFIGEGMWDCLGSTVLKTIYSYFCRGVAAWIFDCCDFLSQIFMHLLTLNIASNHVKLLAYKTEICGPMQLTFNIFVGKPQSAPLTVTTVRQFSLGNGSERSDCKKYQYCF